MKELMKKERAITLIALVVTIIVLLILAGVSIQMLTGQTGILKNAQQAREETTRGQIKEDVQREIMEKMTEGKKGDITSDELYGILNNYFEDVPTPGEGEANPWNAKDFPKNFPDLKSKEGDYTFKLGDIYSGNLSGTQTTGETPGNPDPETGIFTKNSTIDGSKGNYDNPTIPAGFKPVNPDYDSSVGQANWGNGESKPTVDALNAGLVIEDEEQNQFVWVPVPNAKSETIVTTNTEEIELGGYNSQTTPMAEKYDEEGNYREASYDEESYSLTGETKTVKYRQYSTSGNDSYREPDTLTNSLFDENSSNFEIINGILTDEKEKARHNVSDFKITLQEDYNEMVGSVSTYGGFYVGRYEMSLSADKKAQYKKGKTSATASEYSANTWYGLYAYQKEFATKYSSVNSTIKSSMIWGSQYDAMMNWMARCGINIASDEIEGKKRNTTMTTGKDNSTDVLNNVYDLLGNLWDWTLEADGPYVSYFRAARGGCYSGSSATAPSERRYDEPIYDGRGGNVLSHYGSRASLYL